MQLAGVRRVAAEHVREQALALRQGEEVRPEAEQAPRGDAELEPGAGLARVHDDERALALGERLDDRAHRGDGHVGDDALVRLEPLPALLAHDHLGPADAELVALAPHALDEDREVQLAAPRDAVALAAQRLDAQRDVREELALQAVGEVAARNVRALAPGERARVGAERDGDGRLVDLRRRQRLDRVGGGDGVADVDGLEAGYHDDVARLGALRLDALEAEVRVDLRDAGPRRLLAAAGQSHRVAGAD